MERSNTPRSIKRKRVALQASYRRTAVKLTSGKIIQSIVDSPELYVLKSGQHILSPGIKRKPFSEEEDINEFTTLKNECEIHSPNHQMDVSLKEDNLSPQKQSGSVNTENSSGIVELMQRESILPFKFPDMSVQGTEKRISDSYRLPELKTSNALIKAQDRELIKSKGESGDKDKTEHVISMKMIDKIQQKITISPQKIQEKDSLQHKLLSGSNQLIQGSLKESPPTALLYQKYFSLIDCAIIPALPLPYKYEFLTKAFCHMDTVSAMLYNRGETITFNKLKVAMQNVFRRDFTQEHLACIKTVYPESYTLSQIKIHSFGSLLNQDKYELVLVPTHQFKETGNMSSKDGGNAKTDIVKMGPAMLLHRKQTFFNLILKRVYNAHDQFLLQLKTPIKIGNEKIIVRWHPEFDVESSCPEIEMAELPKVPTVQKLTSVLDVLGQINNKIQSYNLNMGMDDRKGLSIEEDKKIADEVDKNKVDLKTNEGLLDKSSKDDPWKKENFTSIADISPSAPSTIKNDYLATVFKGISKSLLDKVKAKQCARKSLEPITPSPMADRKAFLYSRLPELAKILRNIFVAEKRGVLILESVTSKVDHSFRTKLIPTELNDMIQLLCRHLPTWICVRNVRKVDYLTLDRTIDLGQIRKRLEILANVKIFRNSQ